MEIKKIGLLFTLVIMVMTLSAHPPKKITLKFDNKTQELDVRIDHSVKNKNEHFVDNIMVKINGTEVQSNDYTKQKDMKADVYRIVLENVKAGDEIELTASCNKWGKKSKKLTVK